MNLTEKIQEAIKNKKIVIGFKESVKFIKLNKQELIVISRNAPDNMKKEIEYLAKLEGVNIETVENSKELGIICGKPLPVTTLVIKG